MKTATPKQISKVLRILIDDKEVSREHLQWMLRGPLSDLCDANEEGFDRDVYRSALGLKSLKSASRSFIVLLGTVDIPATTTPFIAKNRFTDDVRIRNGCGRIPILDNDFKKWFFDKEQSFKGSTLCYWELDRDSTNTSIIDAVGGEEKAETSLAELFSLIEKQPNGRGDIGPLTSSGRSNIFYIKDVNGVLRMVNVSHHWTDWHIDAHPVTDPTKWYELGRVFLRISR